MSNALPEPDRSRPTRTATPLLFPIGRVPFFSGLLGLVPCASAFPHSGVRSHRILGALQSRSLRPPNPLCSPSRPARRTGRNTGLFPWAIKLFGSAFYGMSHNILWAIPSPHLGHPIINHSHRVSGVFLPKNTGFIHYIATSSEHKSNDIFVIYILMHHHTSKTQWLPMAYVMMRQH